MSTDQVALDFDSYTAGRNQVSDSDCGNHPADETEEAKLARLTEQAERLLPMLRSELGEPSTDMSVPYSLDYTSWGEMFIQPFIDPYTSMVYVSENVYVYTHYPRGDQNSWRRYYDTQSSSSVFGFSRRVFEGGGAFKLNGVKVHRIRMNRRRLEAFIKLPLCDEDQQAWARSKILEMDLVEAVCTEAILLKANTEPRSKLPLLRQATDRHKTPMASVDVVTEREPTNTEQIAIAFGQFDRTALQMRETLLHTLEYVQTLDRHCSPDRTPYSQQLIGAWAIVAGKRVPLWFDMRTGKTLSAIIAFKELVATGRASTMILICPVCNIFNPWVGLDEDRPGELERQGLRPIVLDGTMEVDEESLRKVAAGEADVVVLNYERVHSRLELIEQYVELADTFAALDETSAIKNPDSRRSRACHDLARKVEYITLLNGTPLENGPQDLWSQMHMIDPHGIAWGESFGKFTNTWLFQVGPNKYEVQKNLKLAFEMHISSYGIRYLRSGADQFSGKDKQYRHIKLKPTKEIYDQTIRVLNGFLETMTTLGETRYEKMTSVKIRTMTFLRGIACGYDSYREEEEGPYMRVHHTVDSKLMWVLAHIMANPTQPLVIYTEFTYQEQMLKELLDKHDIKWASTRPHVRRKKRTFIKGLIPIEKYNAMCKLLSKAAQAAKVDGDDELAKKCTSLLGAVQSVAVLPGDAHVALPVPLRLDRYIIDTFRACCVSHTETQKERIEKLRAMADPARNPNVHERHVAAGLLEEALADKTDTSAEYIDTDMVYDVKGSPTYKPWQRSEEIGRFNNGDVQVFICKWTQARGFSLNREQAVAKGIGTWPSIVSLAPTWSLGAWAQGGDRCVVTDPATGKNVCTMFYSLSINGTIEQDMLGALRKKKTVQSELLSDIDRKGFTSFVDEMISSLEDAMGGSGKLFDALEFDARIKLGVPPYSRLTLSLVENKGASRFKDEVNAHAQRKAKGKPSREHFRKWVEEAASNEIKDAYDYLVSVVEKG